MQRPTSLGTRNQNVRTGFRGCRIYPLDPTRIDRFLLAPSPTTDREEAPEIDNTVTAERENAVTEMVTLEMYISLAMDAPATVDLDVLATFDPPVASTSTVSRLLT